MSEFLNKWLNVRMGLGIDMKPEIFGVQMKDGTLIAEILWKYGIVTANDIRSIERTSNSEICLSNLRKVAEWLGTIDISCSEEFIQSVSRGNGLAALRLLYFLFLSLEGKERIQSIVNYKISGRNDKRSRFNVSKETHMTQSTPDNAFSIPILDKNAMITWYKERQKIFAEKCAASKSKFSDLLRSVEERKVIVKESLARISHSEKHRSQPRTKFTISDSRSDSSSQEEGLTFSELMALKQECCDFNCFDVVSTQDVQNYVRRIKEKAEDIARKRQLRTKYQRTLLSELWTAISTEQEREFNFSIGKKLMKQSQYEKRLTTKLYHIKHERNMMVENRITSEKIALHQLEEDVNRSLAQMDGKILEELEKKKLDKRREEQLSETLVTKRQELKHKYILKQVLSIIDDLIDIALGASQIRFINNGKIPSELRDNWKVLFIKSQPIFANMDTIDILHMLDSSQGNKLEPLLLEELTRHKVLNMNDLDKYLELLYPWKFDDILVPEENDTLGHVIYRLLEIKYPTPSPPEPPILPEFTLSAICVGLHGSDIIEMSRELLESQSIHLLVLETIIPIFIEAYKREVARDIDIDLEKFQDPEFASMVLKATKQRSFTGLKERSESILDVMNVIHEINVEVSKSNTLIHQWTQFPSDMLTSKTLSLAAELGKEALQSMAFGESINDTVIARMIVEYVKKLDDVRGWVLLNYPLRLEQAVALEEALSAKKVHYTPADEPCDIIFEVARNSAMMYIEDDDVVEEEPEEHTKYSRLVKNPTPKPLDPPTTTHFKRFIVVKGGSPPKPETSEEQVVSPLENFYVQEEIYVPFYLNMPDFDNAKQLARTIIYGISDSMKFSYFNDPGVILLHKLREAKIAESEVSESGGVGTVIEEGAKQLVDISKEKAIDQQQIKVFVDLPLSREISSALVTIWTTLETTYLREFKRTFMSKRAFGEALIYYAFYIRNELLKFIERPDSKQEFVDVFQAMLNEVSDELRQDTEGKMELHVRVKELQDSLLAICNNRREESEERRQWIINEGWVVDEMINLVNTFIQFVKLEADRTIDTLQLLSDYYLSMFGILPQETRLQKFDIPTVDLEGHEPSVDTGDEEKVKHNLLTDKGLDFKQIRKNIADLLIKRHDSHQTTLCHNALTEAINYATKELENAKNLMIDTIKAQEAQALRNAKDAGTSPGNKGEKDTKSTKGKSTKGKSTKGKEDTAKTGKDKVTEGLPAEKMTEKVANACKDWSSAVELEISRLAYRLQVIQMKGNKDLSEMKKKVQILFYGMIDDIDGRYGREVQSVNDLCDVLCCAIEEQRPVQARLVLENDSFKIKPNVLAFPNPPVPPPPPVIERKSDIEFQVEQISKLYELLYRMSRTCLLPMQTLACLLQDLVTRNGEADVFVLPKEWRDLSSSELICLLENVLGSNEYIHWKDFLIYALDLKYPSQKQLLSSLKQFTSLDKNQNKSVDYTSYNSITFWFEDDATVDPQRALRISLAKKLLFQMYHVDIDRVNYIDLLLAFCKSEDAKCGMVKAFSVILQDYIVYHPCELCDHRKSAASYDGSLQDVENRRLSADSENLDGSWRCDSAIIHRKLNTSISKEDVPMGQRFSTEPFVPSYTGSQSYEINEERMNEGDLDLQSLSSNFNLPSTEESTDSAEQINVPTVEKELPLEVVIQLFSICLPHLPDQRNIFQYDLEQMYLDICRNVVDPVPIAKILNHPFMQNILLIFKKFKAVNLCNEIANVKRMRT